METNIDDLWQKSHLLQEPIGLDSGGKEIKINIQYNIKPRAAGEIIP
jgi:hypothetical protein